jgi:hypothetical protein
LNSNIKNKYKVLNIVDDRYLLYIDVLGFEELVSTAPQRVDELFQIIASLNLHHHGAFSAIVFSDTILVHNIPLPTNDHDRQYIVMYQCEFFRDLMHRVAGRSLALRGLLTYGKFEHYRLKGIPYFYGPALNRAYQSAKSLEITGLLMDKHCQRYSKIFTCRPFNDDWYYVFVTQAIDSYEDGYGAMIPLLDVIAEDTDLCWFLGPELETLAFSSQQARSNPDPRVRAKHIATLEQYRSRYPKVFAALESLDFRMEVVSNKFDWNEVRKRMSEKYSWAAIRRPPLPGSFGRRKSNKIMNQTGR